MAQSIRRLSSRDTRFDNQLVSVADPSVSVVMAIHNGKAYLSEAIDSILNQTFRDLEFIIIDDGSTDGSGALLDSYAASDDRVRIIHQQNSGLTVSLNRGLTFARAPLIARMDGDDIAMPDRLEKQFRFLQTRPEIAALGTWVRMTDENSRDCGEVRSATSPWEVAWTCCMRNSLWHPTMLIRSAWIRNVNGYDESFPVSQDFDLWSRILRAGGQISVLPEALLRYRKSSNQITSKRRSEQDRAVCRVLRDHNAWLSGQTPADDVIGCIWNLLGYGDGKDFRKASAALSAIRQSLRGCENRIGDSKAIRLLRETAWNEFIERAEKNNSLHPKVSRKCVRAAILAHPAGILNPRALYRVLRLCRRNLTR